MRKRLWRDCQSRQTRSDRFVPLAENQLASCRNASAGFLDGISNIDNRGYCRSKQAVQFAAGTLVFETRSKRLHGVFVAISVELFVLDKIPKVLAIVVNQQCFSRRPFRKDNFVGFQLDMEIVDGLAIIHFGQRDCFSIHQPFNRNEKAVDEEAVVRRKEQVTTRVFIAESELRDTDRCNTPVPGWAGFLEPLAPNPFDRLRPPQSIDECTNLQLFDGNFTARLFKSAFREGNTCHCRHRLVRVDHHANRPNPMHLLSSTSMKAWAS